MVFLCHPVDVGALGILQISSLRLWRNGLWNTVSNQSSQPVPHPRTLQRTSSFANYTVNSAGVQHFDLVHVLSHLGSTPRLGLLSPGQAFSQSWWLNRRQVKPSNFPPEETRMQLS